MQSYGPNARREEDEWQADGQGFPYVEALTIISGTEFEEEDN